MTCWLLSRKARLGFNCRIAKTHLYLKTPIFLDELFHHYMTKTTQPSQWSRTSYLHNQATQPSQGKTTGSHSYIHCEPPNRPTKANQPNQIPLIMWGSILLLTVSMAVMTVYTLQRLYTFPMRSDFITCFQVTIISILPMPAKHMHTSFGVRPGDHFKAFQWLPPVCTCPLRFHR